MGLGKDGFDQSDDPDLMRRVAAKAGVDTSGNHLSPEAVRNILGHNIISGLKNAGEGVNPKDKIGASKLDLTLLPTSAKIQWALAQMDGAKRYGPYNWRIEPVQIMTYLGAAERHLESFKEGEEVASDSLVHHLGHVMACCSIIIDAMSQGKAIDNRPVNHRSDNLIDKANATLKTIKERNNVA